MAQIRILLNERCHLYSKQLAAMGDKSSLDEEGNRDFVAHSSVNGFKREGP
jgi:hypothetical protein